MIAGIVIDNELNIDKRVLREIEILKESGHIVNVICFAFDNETYRQPLEGIKITRIRISRRLKNILMFAFNTLPLYEWLWARWIRKFITGNNLEILHVHDLYMSKAGRTGIRRSGKNIPMILDLHENFPYTIATYNWTKGFFRHLISRPGRWMKKEGEYMRLADRFVVLSEAYRDSLTSKYTWLKKESFAVLPNVPDLETVSKIERKQVATPFSNDHPVIFYYGVIAERRGLFDAIRVFRQIIDEGTGANFLIIGPVDKKDKKRFLKAISDERLDGKICHIPWIDSSLFWSWLSVCDICIAPFHKNPQHESGVANKVYEYMLGKKPVIVSDCKPQQDMIMKYDCGLAYSDDKGLHDALIRLIDDKELRIRMGENGNKAITDDYNTVRVKHILLSLYENAG